MLETGRRQERPFVSYVTLFCLRRFYFFLPFFFLFFILPPTYGSKSSSSSYCVSTLSLLPLPGARKGWLRHCSAVALSAGSKHSMGSSQSEKLCATAGSHSYFSVSTSYRRQGFSFVMWRSSPENLIKKMEISRLFSLSRVS